MQQKLVKCNALSATFLLELVTPVRIYVRMYIYNAYIIIYIIINIIIHIIIYNIYVIIYSGINETKQGELQLLVSCLQNHSANL